MPSVFSNLLKLAARLRRRRRPIRVLIVDDDRPFADALEHYLSDHERLDVVAGAVERGDLDVAQLVPRRADETSRCEHLHRRDPSGSSASGRVFNTSRAVAHPRRAVATDSCMFPSPRVECASVEQTIGTPASTASRT
jgi:hypothetical protein